MEILSGRIVISFMGLNWIVFLYHCGLCMSCMSFSTAFELNKYHSTKLNNVSTHGAGFVVYVTANLSSYHGHLL